MKSSATNNKPQEASKIVPSTSGDKNKQVPAAKSLSLKNGKSGSPVPQVEEVVLPPPEKESILINLIKKFTIY